MAYEHLKVVSLEDRELLEQPFTRLFGARLDREPTFEQIRSMTDLATDSGLVYDQQQWLLLRASDSGIPTFMVPMTASTFIHIPHFDERSDGRVPSPRSFLNSVLGRRNLLASPVGLTHYRAVVDQEARQALVNEVMYDGEFDDPKSEVAYLQFLRTIGAQYTVHPWEMLTPDKLTETIYAS